MLKAVKILVVLSVLVTTVPGLAADEVVDPNLPQLRIVFFTPKDVTPPANVEERLTQVARYAEAFFVKWIFLYMGDSPFSNFRGSGNPIQGGWAFANYVATAGDIRQDAGLAEGFHKEFMLKGAIHELGHAFGLPHFGPRLKRNLGNSLMGPVTRFWEQQRGPRDRRGYLTEASAALLWKHPIFSGTAQDRKVKPTVELKSYKARFDRRQKQIEILGRLSSDKKAHSVIVVDDMDNKPGEYWVRAYVGRVAENGDFQVVIDEPVPCGGTYRIAFCFENGIVTGNGENHSLVGAIEKKYRYVRQAYRFD